jgi:hypothetical protein
MMAGRNISATHAAFTSTRVMATCAVVGQAVGTAAAQAAREGITPSELARDPARMTTLQRKLQRDDQTIPGVTASDPDDLARSATVTASSEDQGSAAANVLTGTTRDLPEESRNRWRGAMGPDGAWIELTWDRPVKAGEIQLTFDTGFERQLTLSASDGHTSTMVRGPQPETIRDYEILAWAPDAEGPATIARVDGNYQRLRRHRITAGPMARLRLHVTATNGLPVASLYEVRVKPAPEE